MQYLIQVVCYTGVMLTVYLLLLKDRPMHQLSRIYLLANVMLPLLLPFMTLPGALQNKMPQINMISMQLDEITVGTAGNTTMASFRLLMYVYVAIVFCLAIVQVRNLIRIRAIVKRATKESNDHYTLLTNTGYGPGSWGTYIFLPGGGTEKDIIAHEAAHISLKHTYDLQFLNIVQAVCWINPFLLLLRKELVLVHEFQADAAVDTDKDLYARLLVSSLFNTCTIPSSHSFIIHPIKRRIMMLYKKSNRPALLKKSLLITSVTALLASGIITLQSCERTPNQPTSAVVYNGKEVQKMPEFDGNLAEYMSKAIKYPKEAQDNNIEGRVVIKFVVDENGAVKDATVAKSPSQVLSDEALRVVSTMPNWTPGEKDGKKVKVEFYLPVSFKMGKDNAS